MSSKQLTLIQQNDSHGQLGLHPELFWKNGTADYRNCGGFSPVASLVKQMRQEVNGNCLFIDCGDSIHGTAAAQWSKGEALIAPLNALGLDYMTPGNWEFGFGPEVLRQRVAQMNFPVLAANVEKAETGEPEFLPTTVHEVAGLRVGLVAMTSPIVTERMPRAFGLGLRFTDPVDILPQYVRELRTKEDVDLVVLVSHLGLAQDMELAHQVEGIDVVLSGHTHDRVSRPILIGRTILMQSGFSGSFLGRLDLEISNRRVVDFRHELVEVAESVSVDAASQSVVEEVLRPYRDRLSEVVGKTSSPLHRMTVLESPMDNFITDSYREATGAEVSFSHGWRYGAPVLAGPITEEHLWQMVPTNPEMFTAEMTGEQIRQILEQSMESVYAGNPLRQKGGYPIRFSGMSAVVRLNNPSGARVAQLDIAGRAYSPERRYTVVAAGEQDIQQAANKQKLGFHSLDALRAYLKKHGEISPVITNEKLVAI